MTTTILLDGNVLTIDAVRRVADERAPVALAPAARNRLARARAIVDGIVARNDAVYGATTGFGKLSDVAIPPDRLAIATAKAEGLDRPMV